MTAEPAGVGLGFRFPHAHDVLQNLPPIPWFELMADDLLFAPQRARIAQRVSDNYPIALHSVGMNIAGADALDISYIDQLGALLRNHEAAWLSDHLCWSASAKRQHFDLLPFPFNNDQLGYISSRVHQVQERIGRALVLENISYYTRFKDDEMSEWEFHSQLHKKTGCLLLLDLNNLWSNALNFDQDPIDELNHLIDRMPGGSICQVHLAGSTRQEDALPYWIDAHAEAVPDPVIELMCCLQECYGEVPSIIERDHSIPSFDVLREERDFLHKAIIKAADYVPGAKRKYTGPNILRAVEGDEQIS